VLKPDPPSGRGESFLVRARACSGQLRICWPKLLCPQRLCSKPYPLAGGFPGSHHPGRPQCPAERCCRVHMAFGGWCPGQSLLRWHLKGPSTPWCGAGVSGASLAALPSVSGVTFTHPSSWGQGKELCSSVNGKGGHGGGARGKMLRVCSSKADLKPLFQTPRQVRPAFAGNLQ